MSDTQGSKCDRYIDPARPIVKFYSHLPLTFERALSREMHGDTSEASDENRASPSADGCPPQPLVPGRHTSYMTPNLQAPLPGSPVG